LDNLAAFLAGSGIMVTDRMVRRSLREANRWCISALLPLSKEEVQRVLSHHPEPAKQSMPEELLQTPFFLNEYLKEEGSGDSSAEVLEHWFRQHASLSISQLETTARAAYEVYAAYKSRMFPLSHFQDLTSKDVVDRLLGARALLTDAHCA